MDGGKGTNVFIFTRVNDTDPFTYEGKGAVKEYFDTRPVKIIWTFDNAGNIDNYDPAIPGQIPPGSIPEGAVSQVLVNKYERNPWARRECVKHFGAICQVCNFNFEDYYGEIGKDFIHVHHLTSISAIKSEYQVDPLNDLIPVCPNCHSMLHKRTPALTIQELKQILDLNKHQRRL
ncbi:MAG: HNH endonuclease [Mucilaginibacter sp.]|uniref:HNH endonuclease n=1 Tax=Mucilaginibacter sp. TaxID=1882438 RepID=UPI0031AF6C5A